MSKSKGLSSVSKSPEYAEGVKANGDNQNADACPPRYEGVKRSHWMAGWYAAEAKKQRERRATAEAE